MASDPPDDEPVEHDPEVARIKAEVPPLPKERREPELPQDIGDLVWGIVERNGLRLMYPDDPPYAFDRFEAYDTKRGGMGMIIEARDPQLDRQVAIKLWMTEGPESERALRDEAKLLAKLNHPNVVTIHETGKWGDHVYFVMEWIEGRDGHVWMTEQQRAWREVRDVFVLAGRGLAAAHAAGILHRDFKPANMLVGHDGRVLVADFGVGALMRSLAEEQDAPRQQAGTLVYMAPERLRGRNGDARSDQFSFCAAIWRALHGVRPYGGQKTHELLEAIDGGMIRGVWTEDVVPRWLSRVVVRGLQPDPDDRFDNMDALLDALLDEPAEPSSVDDEAAPEAPGDDGEHVLHGPAHDLDALRRPRRGRLLFLGGALAGVTATALFAVGLADEPAPTRTTRVPPPTHVTPTQPPLEDEPDPEPAPPRTIPEQVIQKIDAGEYDAADLMWRNETKRRDVEKIPTHADSIRIGKAFLEAAKQIAKDKKKDRAKEIKNIAAQWGHAAKSNLELYGESPEAGKTFLDDVKKFGESLQFSQSK